MFVLRSKWIMSTRKFLAHTTKNLIQLCGVCVCFYLFRDIPMTNGFPTVTYDWQDVTSEFLHSVTGTILKNQFFKTDFYVYRVIHVDSKQAILRQTHMLLGA